SRAAFPYTTLFRSYTSTPSEIADFSVFSLVGVSVKVWKSTEKNPVYRPALLRPSKESTDGAFPLTPLPRPNSYEIWLKLPAKPGDKLAHWYIVREWLIM